MEEEEEEKNAKQIVISITRKVNVLVVAHVPVLARLSTYFMKLKTSQYIFVWKV